VFQQFLYLSRLAPACPLADVVHIISTSRRKNLATGITGVLCFDGNSFCQYIEGEAAALESLRHSILADWRHQDIRVLLDGQMPARAFSGWGIGYDYQHTMQLLSRINQLQGEAALAELKQRLPDFVFL